MTQAVQPAPPAFKGQENDMTISLTDLPIAVKHYLGTRVTISVYIRPKTGTVINIGEDSRSIYRHRTPDSLMSHTRKTGRIRSITAGDKLSATIVENDVVLST
jgi:hypothetical protein